MTWPAAAPPSARSAHPGRLWSPRETLCEPSWLLCVSLLPSRAPPLRVGGEQSLHFSPPTVAASVFFRSPLPLSRVYTGLRGLTESSSRFLFVSSRTGVLERWGLGIQIPRAIFISNLILQPPALKSLLICKKRWTFLCVCELHTTPQRPQSWAVKLEKSVGPRSPDRTRKKQLSNRLAPAPRSQLLSEPVGWLSWGPDLWSPQG